jgi:hypothetical protein
MKIVLTATEYSRLLSSIELQIVDRKPKSRSISAKPANRRRRTPSAAKVPERVKIPRKPRTTKPVVEPVADDVEHQIRELAKACPNLETLIQKLSKGGHFEWLALALNLDEKHKLVYMG